MHRLYMGVASLGSLMTDVGGPRSNGRRLLVSSVNFVILYGAEFWAQALSKQCYSNQLCESKRQVHVGLLPHTGLYPSRPSL